jgi:hypothetical protein
MAKNAHNPFDELGSVVDLTPVEKAFIDNLPMNVLSVNNMQKHIKDTTGKTLSVAEIMKLGDDLASKGFVISEKSMCGQSFMKKS